MCKHRHSIGTKILISHSATMPLSIYSNQTICIQLFIYFSFEFVGGNKFVLCTYLNKENLNNLFVHGMEFTLRMECITLVLIE